jgi:hypothetical protein
VDASKDLTELVDIDPTRVDLVKNPANGFPVLLMKALAPEPAPEHAGTQAAKETGVSEAPVTQTPEVIEPQVEAPVEKSAAELLDEAVAKAVTPLQEVIKGLESEMAALKSTPIPGGPVITQTSQASEGQRAQHLAKAAYHERLAGSVGDRELARYHEDKAAEARQAANA